MSASDQYDNFFQTDATADVLKRRAAKSSNAHGDPTRLQSKISAIQTDGVSIFAAEATGTVRRVNLETHETDVILKGPTAPLTSLAILPPAKVGQPHVLYTGCWDKNIYHIEVAAGAKTKTLAARHTDFVKCLSVIRLGVNRSVLLSGSADRSVAVWDAESGRHLLQLKNHHRTSLTAIAADPVDCQTGQVVFFSSSSDGEISRTVLKVEGEGESTTATLVSKAPLPTPHPTTIYQLVYHGDDLDLLTASADGTAAILSRHHGWEIETRFNHKGHVRSVLSAADASYIVSGGRDETAKVWDPSSGSLLVTIEGHFDEVVAMTLVPGSSKFATASLDGTVRSWDWRGELERLRASQAGEIQSHEQLAKSLLTAEEEAELAELMSDDG